MNVAPGASVLPRGAVDHDRDPARPGLLAACACGQSELVDEAVAIAPSTVGRHLDRLRRPCGEVDRPAPTRVDLLRDALDDGVLPEAHEPSLDHG